MGPNLVGRCLAIVLSLALHAAALLAAARLEGRPPSTAAAAPLAVELVEVPAARARASAPAPERPGAEATGPALSPAAPAPDPLRPAASSPPLAPRPPARPGPPSPEPVPPRDGWMTMRNTGAPGPSAGDVVLPAGPDGGARGAPPPAGAPGAPGAAAALAAAAAEAGAPPGRSPLELPPGRRPRRPPPAMVPDGDGRARGERLTFVARVDRDGLVRFEDRPNLQAAVGPAGIGGSFDLTDAALRSRGIDPYRFEKARFLAETWDERVAMAAADRQERTRQALRLLPALLAAVWREPRWTRAERRRILFELWDECAEAGSAELVRAGDTARATILAFIRARLPAGSAHAYTADELAGLDRRRRSRARFVPYAAP